MITTRDGHTFIGCDHNDTDPRHIDAGAYRNHNCGQPAVVLIVTEGEIWHAGDVQEWITEAAGFCADHAPEEVHEADTTMSHQERVIVNLPDQARAEAWDEGWSTARDSDWYAQPRNPYRPH